MKKKKVFVIILSTILTLLLIMIFYILFFKNKNIENPNNKIENPIYNNTENLVLELENDYGYTEKEINAGINVKVEGIEYCYYEGDCFKNIFLACQPGSYIHFLDETSPYNFMVMSKYENNCMLLIQDLKNTGSENINCQIPLTEMTEDTLNKFLSLNQENLDKYCK